MSGNAIPEKRDLLTMAVLMLVTLGFYHFYWLYKTKEDINKIGGSVPTFVFAILPFFNIYFNYRYAQDFVKYIRKTDDTAPIILFFLLLLFAPIFIAPFMIQYELNNYANRR